MLGSFFNAQIIFQSLIGGWRNISLVSGALWEKFGLLRTIFLKNDWLLARLLNVFFYTFSYAKCGDMLGSKPVITVPFGFLFFFLDMFLHT